MNIKHHYISQNSSMRESLQMLETNDAKIVLVVDNEYSLIGTVTDGDVRRAILKGQKYDTKVQNIMANSPVTLPANSSRDTIIKTMIKSNICQIILVDDHNIPVDIKSLEAMETAHKKENWVVLMAGGLGSRLGYLTENTPKPMLKIGSQPILEILINRFKELGFYKFYICVNYKADKIMEYFGDGDTFGIKIRYIKEKEKLNTAGALSLIPEKPQLPFFVANGDIVTSLNFENMLNFHNEHNSKATMAIRKYTQRMPYGVVEVQNYKIHNFIEKPEKDHFINAGIYLLDPEILGLLEKNTPCTMPTLFERARNIDMPVFAFPIREYWIDIGQPNDYHQANIDYMNTDQKTIK